MAKIPTRSEIQAEIDKLIADSTIEPDQYYIEIEKWLNTLQLEPVTVAGQTIDPKQQILDDLGSYIGFSD